MKLSNEKVCEMIKQTRSELSDEEFDVNASLRGIGLDSLDIMAVLYLVQEQTGVEVPDEEINNLDTIAKIVEYVNSR